MCHAAPGSRPGPRGRALLCPDCVDQVDELAEHLAATYPEQNAEAYDDGGFGLPDFDDLDPDPTRIRRTSCTDPRTRCCPTSDAEPGPQVGSVTPGDEVICPSRVAAIDDLADDLADNAADDEDRQPSGADRYVTALGEQRQYVLQPDGTISVGDPGHVVHRDPDPAGSY